MLSAIGTVSNGWAALLATSSLSEQCRLAVERGFGYVELRQGACAECESIEPGYDRPWPGPDRLAGLRKELPGLAMNLAVEAPFMTRPIPAGDPFLNRCAEGALALGGDPPTVRLVDLSPAPAILDDAGAERLGASVAGVAHHLWQRGVALALENSRQPVSALIAVIGHARAFLPEAVPAPRICWDPANQILQNFELEEPVEMAQSVPKDAWFMVHFKQVHAGAVLPDMRDGELDWPAILAALDSRGFDRPGLFELPAGPDIWDRLDRGREYIHTCGPRVADKV